MLGSLPIYKYKYLVLFFNAYDICYLCKWKVLCRPACSLLFSFAVIFRKCQLGVHWCRRGPSAEERWLSPLQDYDGVQVQPQAPDHWHTPPELTQRALVSATLYYAWQVGVLLFYQSAVFVQFSVTSLEQCYCMQLSFHVVFLAALVTLCGLFLKAVTLERRADRILVLV